MKSILLIILSFISWTTLHGQNNFLDNYIGATVTSTTIADSVNNGIARPRDLDFKPNSNEVWVCNYANSTGGTMVIVYDAGKPTQSSQFRKDTHSDHFMAYPSAFAFGTDGRWGSVGEIRSTAGSSTFMGPSLWSSDTAIFARVFQSNWGAGLPLGSHLDMLHQSPFSMGIAHDTGLAYWVMDGFNGNICRYDFVSDHGPGYEDHSNGIIHRYTDVSFSRVTGIPSHVVLDKESGWLYFIDGGTKKVKRMNTLTGSVTGTLNTPSSAP
jgi:hypothetical protein